MSFNVSQISQSEIQIFHKLYWSEKNDEHEVYFEFDKQVLYRYEGLNMEAGQIFHWSNKFSNISLKHTYILEQYSSDDSTIRFILSRTSEDFLPKKRQTFTSSDIPRLVEESEIKFKVGQLFIDKDGKLIRFLNYTIVEDVDIELTNDRIKNPHRTYIYKDVLGFTLLEESEIGLPEDKWSQKVYYDPRDISNLELLEIDGTPEQFDEHIRKLIQDGEYQSQQLKIGENDENNKEESALVGLASKAHLQGIIETAQIHKKQAEIASRGSQRFLRLQRREIEKRKAEIEETIRDEREKIEHLQKIAKNQMLVLQKQIGRMEKIIASLEIYAGIKEDIVQINSGQPSITEKLSLRQKTVYLDEEMAMYQDQGLVWQKLSDFDDWLMKEDRYKDLLPEDRCVVLAKVRRNNRQLRWIEDPFARCSIMNSENGILVLMRNGENIYRIYSEHLGTSSRLFPKKAELQEMFENMSKMNSDEQIENKLFGYNKNLLLIHGILSRTEIFHPMPAHVNIMKPETHKDFINYIYDDEMVIGSGGETFREWQKRVNTNIQAGSRVLLSIESLSSYGNYNANDFVDRFNIYWQNDWSRPNMPSTGAYKIKKDKNEIFGHTKRHQLKLSEYLSMSPEDLKQFGEIWKVEKMDLLNGEGMVTLFLLWEDGKQQKRVVEDCLRILYSERDGNKTDLFDHSSNVNTDRGRIVSFKIDPDDDFILDIDNIDLQDVENLLADKCQRENYLHTFPLLVEIRNILRKEMKNEEEFSESMSQRLSLELNIDQEEVKKHILEAIKWYKESLPVKTKRPLPTSKDKDGEISKAWRNIELRAKRTLKKQFKLKIDVSGTTKIKSARFEKICRNIKSERFDVKIQTNITSKKKFVDMVYKELVVNHHIMNVTKADIKRQMETFENGSSEIKQINKI